MSGSHEQRQGRKSAEHSHGHSMVSGLVCLLVVGGIEIHAREAGDQLFGAMLSVHGVKWKSVWLITNVPGLCPSKIL